MEESDRDGRRIGGEESHEVDGVGTAVVVSHGKGEIGKRIDVSFGSAPVQTFSINFCPLQDRATVVGDGALSASLSKGHSATALTSRTSPTLPSRSRATYGRFQSH